MNVPRWRSTNSYFVVNAHISSEIAQISGQERDSCIVIPACTRRNRAGPSTKIHPARLVSPLLLSCADVVPSRRTNEEARGGDVQILLVAAEFIRHSGKRQSHPPGKIIDIRRSACSPNGKEKA
jgi:hypothetical protein